MSNLRQIGAGLEIYTQNHDDIFPIALGGNAGVGYWTGPGRLKPWIKNKDFMAIFGLKPFGASQTGTIFSCPSHDGQSMPGYPLFENSVVSYAENMYFGDIWLEGITRKRIQFPSPSQTMAFMDGLAYWVSAGTVGTPASPENIGYRHSKGANALFLDDHVRPEQADNIPIDSTNTFWRHY